jgi:23S rRNA (adenine2503-C2)-methyltransferase
LKVKSGVRSLVGLDTVELTELFSTRSDARWRAKQVATWIYGKATDSIDDMHDLPLVLREDLKKQFVVDPLETVDRFVAPDGTEKLLVKGESDGAFECVLFPTSARTSCCISSQVGCPMGCAFCATGLGGFDRNLTAGEIVGQYLALQRISEKRISHVVFMGMGEPLLNLPNVVKAIELMGNEIGLSMRHVTISTVGIVPQIRKLAEYKLPIHLALSLHSPFDEIRGELMPVNKSWPVAEVMNAMRYYYTKTKRKITIEYLLIGGVTDSPDQARELARLVKGVPNVVNLIPFNVVKTEQGFTRPTKESIQSFRGILESCGTNVTQRVERGHNIAAACGQLAGQHHGSRRNTPSELPVLSS